MSVIRQPANADPYGDPAVEAGKELGAFISAVQQLFGREQARNAANYWLEALERVDFRRGGYPYFRQVTIEAARHLASDITGIRFIDLN